MNDQKEARRQSMLATITQLVREAVAEQIEAVENAAAEASEDKDDGAPVVAKIAVAIRWPAGDPQPEIEIKSSYSVRRSIEASAVADGSQTVLPLN